MPDICAEQFSVAMSKKILVFGASNSKSSINKKFAVFAAGQLEGISPLVVDLNDFELPLYSPDLEKELGVPENALKFSQLIESADALVVSFAEYNGLYTSAFKNLWDWMSRLGSPAIWKGKPMFLLSTSPSRRKENYVMKVSREIFPRVGATIVASFYLPSFNHFFNGQEIVEAQYKQGFEQALQSFQSYLNEA